MDQSWREQGNVSTSAFLFTVDDLIDLALFRLWCADDCEVLLGSECLTEPSGSSATRFSFGCADMMA